MRIEDVRVHKCFAGWRNWVFVEVETASGIIGIGEATLEGRELTIEGHLADLTRYFIGKDARSISEHRMRLVRDPFWVGGSVQMTGLAAVEIALWDIVGKSLGCPVWQLLGGKAREKIRAYANGWYFGAETTEDWVDRAMEVVDFGYTAMKFDPFGTAGADIDYTQVQSAVEIVAGIRDRVGAGIDLMIEAHGRFDLHSAARVAAALAPFNCYWLEEPLHPGNEAVLSQFAATCPIPVATGERSHSIIDYGRLFAAGNIAVVQPDVIHNGGVIETLKIAGLAEAHSVPVALHNPNGPVATAASLTLDAILPNVLVQEMLDPWDVAWRSEIVDYSPRVVDGYLLPSDRPGLGLELDIGRLKEHPYQDIDLNFYSEGSVLETVDLKGVVDLRSDQAQSGRSHTSVSE